MTEQQTEKEENKWINLIPYLLLALAIIAVSFAAVIVVKLQQANVRSEVTAMYRTLFAGIGALLISMGKKDISWAKKRSTIKKYHWIILAGVLLAVHFATWFVSLEYVSVAISTTMVDTVPIFLAIFGFVFFKEKVSWIGIVGIIITVGGGILLAFAKSEEGVIGTNPMVGIVLAVIGALAVTFYFLIGKKILIDSPLWPYFGLVNLISGISLLIYNLIRGYELINHSSVIFLLFGLLAIGPSLVGHATYNYSMRRLPAFIVGVAIVGEPIGATILGIIVLGQIPSVTSIVYAIIMLAGIALTSASPYLKNQKKRKKEEMVVVEEIN